MQVEIPYGDEPLAAELPERTVVLSGEARQKLEPLNDVEAEVRRALDAPLDSPPIEKLVRPGSRVVIAFDDATVMSFGPIRRLALLEVLSRLNGAGVADENIQLICANALHRKQRPEELEQMLGDDLVARFGQRLFSHDAEDAEQLVHLGQTPEGYDVELNRHFVESDLTIYLNAAHNRGFCGGWKSICVGLATYRSIRHHHTPDGMSMSIHDNRMHAMLDAMGRVAEQHIAGKIFKIDTLLANPWQVARVFAGSVWETRRAAMEVMSELYPPRRSMSGEKFDCLIYGVPNWSPYAVGSYMNPLLTLVSSGLGYLGGPVQALGAPGCSVIMVTPCVDQWDTVHHAPYPRVWNEVLAETRDAYEIDSKFAETYATDGPLIEKYRHEFAFHPVHAILATHPLKRLRHIGQVFVAGPKSPAIVEHLGFEPTATIDDALAEVEGRHGPDCRLAYVAHPVVPTKLMM